MDNILLDLNGPIFQKDFFNLQKTEQLALIKTLKKISQLTWRMLYVDQGLKWELVVSKTAENGDRIYSFRFSNKHRALALRQDDFLRLLSLHVDHDSAYRP